LFTNFFTGRFVDYFLLTDGHSANDHHQQSPQHVPAGAKQECFFGILEHSKMEMDETDDLIFFITPKTI
jgi:hypothetical protein